MMRWLAMLLGGLTIGLSPAWAAPIPLSWTLGAGGGTVHTFHIERKDGMCAAAGPFVEIATPAAALRTYSDTLVTEGMPYGYRMAASNPAGKSAYSNCVDKTAPFTVPSPPVLSQYVDPAQLTVPWPKHSHYKQPWRGWAETVPATRLRDGIGLNYQWHVARNHAVDMARYAAAGFTRTRTEVSWGLGDYTTGGLTPGVAAKLTEIVQSAQANGIRPLILLNGNDVNPCPFLTTTRRVTLAAGVGARSVTLDVVTGLVPHHSGLSLPGDRKMAGVLITAVNATARTVTLSRPLPESLPLNRIVTIHTLKAKPLRDPGTPEYEETLARWLTYVRAIVQTVQAAGVPSFDVEVWNELTFGSAFLYASDYYDPPVTNDAVHELSPGARLWSFGQRTVAMLAAEFPTVTPVWGFSNTAFFSGSQDPDQGDLRDLPPNVRGQSYHPYFFWRWDSPSDEQYGFGHNLERYAPPAPYRVAMPEKALGYVNTESLARLLQPSARALQPPGFQHYMTEHGADVGVDPRLLQPLFKQKMALRSAVAFVHRGITGIYLFADRESELALDPDVLPVLTRLTAPLRTAVQVPSPRPVAVAVALDGQVFPGDATHPPLAALDTLGVFVFQASPQRFLVAVYVLTRDLTVPTLNAPATVHMIGLVGDGATVSATDPLTGAVVPVVVLARTPTSLTLTLPVTDSPRWLEIQG